MDVSTRRRLVFMAVARDCALTAAPYRRFLVWSGLLLLGIADPRPANAQQPFVVDDAEVTLRRAWHVEVSSQVDWLKREARPFRWQNTLEWELDYGLTDRVELSALLPVISLVSDGPGSRTAVGIGDTSFGLKRRFTRDPLATHAYAGSLTVEFPSGARSRSLGSGLVDYGMNLISQHRLHDTVVLRVNGGLILAGNTQMGAVGIKERGPIVTGGTSVVVGVSSRVTLGAESMVFYSRKATLGGSYVGWQIGANVKMKEGTTLDAGILSGWFDGSPRLGVQVGASIDLSR